MERALKQAIKSIIRQFNVTSGNKIARDLDYGDRPDFSSRSRLMAYYLAAQIIIKNKFELNCNYSYVY